MYRLARSHIAFSCCASLIGLWVCLILLARPAGAQQKLWFPSVQAHGNRRVIDAHRSQLQSTWPAASRTATDARPAGTPHSPAKPVTGNVAQTAHRSEAIVVEDGEILLDDAIAFDSQAPCDCDVCAGCLKRKHLIQGRLWARAEWLNWWSSSMDAPALVTTSPDTVLPANAGILGEPTTTTLFGGDLADNDRGGMRYSFGYLLKPCQNLSLVATYVHLGDARSSFQATDAEFPVLVRPFFDVETGQQNGSRIAFPGEATGAISVTATSAFDSFDLAFSQLTCSTPRCSKEFSVGFRYARLRDQLRVDSTTTALTGVAAGTTLTGFDQFDADNTFYGGQLGLVFRSYHCAWSFDFLLKFALGGTNTDVRTNGLTEIDGTSTTTREGNLLTQSSNIGSVDSMQFAVLSELGLRVNYQISSCWNITAAYTFLHLSEVARASEQIDTQVNLSQIPPSTLTGPLAPLLNLNTNDYWVQGVSLGIERRF